MRRLSSILLAIWRVDKAKDGTLTKTELFGVRVSRAWFRIHKLVLMLLALVSLLSSMFPSQTRKLNGLHESWSHDDISDLSNVKTNFPDSERRESGL